MTDVLSLEANSNSFLMLRPEWTLTGAMLRCGARGDFNLEQRPFRWIEGVWEADVIVSPTDTDKVPHQLTLRIASDTVRQILVGSDFAFESRGTHKLKGDLADLWSCSAGYDLRIVFRLGKDDRGNLIELLSIGTHDEVY